MSWVNFLQPNLMLAGSVFEITPDLLERYGLRGLILDVDETLVPSYTPQVSAELQQWVNSLRPQVKLWLVTNNLNPIRIGRIARDLDLPYLLAARKPSRRKLRQAAAAMELPFEQVAMVGDRLFTDVLAGNRLGMFTILVDPIALAGKPTRTYWVRDLEVWLSQLLGASLGERR